MNQFQPTTVFPAELNTRAFTAAMLTNDLIPVAILDPEFNFICVNAAYARIANKAPNDFPCTHFFDVACDETLLAAFTQALQHKQSICGQTRANLFLRTGASDNPKDATWDWSLSPTLDSSGNIDGFILCLIDSSQRIENEIKLRRTTHSLKLINAVNECLIVARDEQHFLNEICRTFVEVGGYRMAWIGYAGQNQQKTVLPVAQAGFDEGYLDAIIISWDNNAYGLCPAGTAIRTGKPVIVNDIPQDPQFEQWRILAVTRGYASSIALPLTHGEIMYGSLSLYAPTVNHFNDPHESYLLGVLSHNIAFRVAALRSQAEHAEVVAQIRHSEEELRAILNSMQDTCYQVDAEGYITLVSPSVVTLLGYTPEEVLGTQLASYYADADDRAKFLEKLRAHNGKISNYETPLRHKDGSLVWVSTNAHYIYNKAGTIVGIEGTTRDVTQRRQSEADMRELSAALEQTADAVSIISLDGAIEYINTAYENTTGYSKKEVLGKNANILRSGKHSKKFYQNLWQTVLRGDVFFDVFINRRKDGSLYYQETSISPLKNEHGDILKFISVGKDITERMETQQRLQYLAHHDVLTSLPNRALFMDRLNHALSRTLGRNEKLAVLFLDIDRFKVINDTLGHNVGDQVLMDLAQRLQKRVYKGDTIARLSGDEFAVIIENLSHTENAIALARAILEELAEPFFIDGRALFVTTSIGISISPADGTDSQTLLKHADIAMYRAKDKGRNTYQFYSSDMSTRALERLSLETHLRYALERNEFFLDYQPQILAQSGELIGVEALLRWRHPDLGIIMPADFISILEETGLIANVGEWVIRQACAQAAAWHRQVSQRFQISINLSAHQFSDPSLLSRIHSALNESQLDPELLEIEITESVIMRDDPWVKQTFEALEAMKVRIAIDDFGTEYSSLSYLKRFPVTTLKIDRSFVRDITSDPDDAAIVKAIIAMGKSLKLQVIAEGVENEKQLAFLTEQGCDVVQGFLFDMPPHLKTQTACTI